MSPRHAVLLAAALACAAPAPDTRGAVFGRDERKPFDQVAAASIGARQSAIGSISCSDGHAGTGFVVDVASYVEAELDFYIVATAARALFDDQTGESRGRCAYRPADLPGVHLEIRDSLAGAQRLDNADSGDWAFARVDRLSYDLGSLRIAFGDTYDFDSSYDLELWAIGFVEERDGFFVSSGCELDDKSDYPVPSLQRGGFDRMIIHDCDFLGSAKGGPLVVRNAGVVRVIALNVGDSGGRRFPRLRAVPYDPKRDFFNFSRRFDKELEDKMLAFVSRFASLKDPPQIIQVRSELIRKVQSNLGRLGYDTGPVDGFVGRKTRDAIRAFQTSLGITPTGRVSEELLLLLEGK